MDNYMEKSYPSNENGGFDNQNIELNHNVVHPIDQQDKDENARLAAETMQNITRNKAVNEVTRSEKNVLNSIPPTFVDTSKDNRALSTDSNLKILGSHIGIEFAFNKMTFQPEAINSNRQNISDNQLSSRLISYASRYGLPKSAIDDHLIAVCEVNPYHPVKRWLDHGGDWDGVPRVQTVINYLNAKHSEISSTVLKRWLVGCIACLYEASFKSKLVPVLQGAQSYRKTAFIERIAKVMDGSFLEGAELNPDNKDSVLTCTRSWIAELGELERTSKNSQGSLKAFLSKSIDTVRPPYARNDIHKPRQTSFLATVNGSDFLKDETGSSRFAVIEMAAPADMDSVNAILGWVFTGTGGLKLAYPEKLKQFWLEVKDLYDNNYSWLLSDSELQKIQKINGNFDDKGSLYEYILGAYIHGKDESAKVGWVTAGELIKQDRSLSAHNAGQIGKALKKLANDKFIISKSIGGNKTSYYLAPIGEKP